MRSRLDGLLARLNAVCRRTLESATGAALLRGHAEVTLVHWLAELLRGPAQNDLLAIAESSCQSPQRWLQVVLEELTRIPAASAARPRIGLDLDKALGEAWAIASLDDGAPRIRSGYVLLAMAESQHPAFAYFGIDAVALRQEFPRWTAASVETDAPPPADAQGALARYSRDLTAEARAGQFEPVIGREGVVREVLEVLARRRQNNPLLLGEPGVGKTALVEALAQRLASGQVPGTLARAAIRSLDIASIQAGAAAVGELEQRLQSLLREVAESATPIILFIDEAHTLFRLGAGAGTIDAVNLLKPVLARGELRTIAATTPSEFKRHFESDGAFLRRFQVVRVEEPDAEEAVWILRGLKASLEGHHHVRIAESALRAAVRLSQRYLADRQLPDKAISLLDTAAARVALAQSGEPAAIEQLRATVARLESAADAAAATDDALAIAETRLADAERRYEEERMLAKEIERLREAGADPAAATAELMRLQGDQPLVPQEVDERSVAAVVSSWTGVPASRVIGAERESVLQLRSLMAERIAGQDHAIDVIVKRILASRAGLSDEGRPVGVFLLAGPSGCGKSETPRALAEVLYTGERDLITVSLSEYQEAHSISGLRGAPPGYVGYGEGGFLTEALRRRPHSVVLLDEVEKAHPDVREFLYQMLDQGRMEDAAGRRIDVRHATIFLTSNLGAAEIEAACHDTVPSPGVLLARIESELRRVLRPAFLGRVTVIPYYPLPLNAYRQIVEWRLSRLVSRLWDRHRIRLEFDEEFAESLASRSLDGEGGARSIDRLLAETLLADLSRQIVSGSLQSGDTVRADWAGTGIRYRRVIAP